MTVIVLLMPPPVIVIVPVLVAPVFAMTSMKIVPSPFPLDGETTSQDALLDTVHDTFEVIFAEVPPANDGGDQDVLDTSSSDDGAAAPCTTVIVLVIPPPDMVMLPVLPDVAVFAVTLTVIEPLPDPLEGETVSQEDALLEAVQDTFDVIDAVVLASEDNGDHDPVETTSDGVGGGVGVGVG